jgi:hypothetical protein
MYLFCDVPFHISITHLFPPANDILCRETVLPSNALKRLYLEGAKMERLLETADADLHIFDSYIYMPVQNEKTPLTYNNHKNTSNIIHPGAPPPRRLTNSQRERENIF